MKPTELDVEAPSEDFNHEVGVYLKELFDTSVAALKPQEKTEVRQLFNEYSDIFATHSNDFGRTHWVQHEIDTGDERPVKQ